MLLISSMIALNTITTKHARAEYIDHLLRAHLVVWSLNIYGTKDFMHWQIAYSFPPGGVRVVHDAPGNLMQVLCSSAVSQGPPTGVESMNVVWFMRHHDVHKYLTCSSKKGKTVPQAAVCGYLFEGSAGLFRRVRLGFLSGRQVSHISKFQALALEAETVMSIAAAPWHPLYYWDAHLLLLYTLIMDGIGMETSMVEIFTVTLWICAPRPVAF